MAAGSPPDQNLQPDINQVEGRNPVLEAIRGPRRIEGIYIAAGTGRTGIIGEIISEAHRESVPIVEVEKKELQRMARTSTPQGVIARVSQFPYATLEEVIRPPATGKPPLLLILDGVEDPQNFGAILRIADATGVGGVIVSRRRSCPVTPTVCKASAGAVEYVKLVRVPNLVAAVKRLKKEGFWIVGADAAAEVPYYLVDMSVPSAVILGGEGKGLSRLVKENCDTLAGLPMQGRVSSLNVATTGAVLLYEARRQRSQGRDDNR